MLSGLVHRSQCGETIVITTGQSPSLETHEEPKQVRAFLSPLDHCRWGRHWNSGTLTVLSWVCVMFTIISTPHECLYSPQVLTYHLQPQLSGQGVSFLKLFPPEPTCTNCASVSSLDSPLPDEKPMQPTAAVAWCYQFVWGALNFLALWQVHSLLDSSSHESDEASLLNTTAREQVVASCTYANP